METQRPSTTVFLPQNHAKPAVGWAKAKGLHYKPGVHMVGRTHHLKHHLLPPTELPFIGKLNQKQKSQDVSLLPQYGTLVPVWYGSVAPVWHILILY